MKRLIKLSLLLLMASTTFAQTNEPQMADTFRSEGKIYVVILVLSVVFCCLATYLIMIDKKLKKIEDRFTKNK